MLISGGVLLAGVLLILLDTPLPFLLIGTAATGLMILVLTGGLQPAPDLRQFSGSKEPVLSGQGTVAKPSILKRFRRAGRKKEDPASLSLPPQRGKGGHGRGWIQAILSRILPSNQPRIPAPEPEDPIQKIDILLDSLINQAPAERQPGGVAGKPPATLQVGLGSLRELSEARLQEDLLGGESGVEGRDDPEHLDLSEETNGPRDQVRRPEDVPAVPMDEMVEQEDKDDLEPMDLSNLEMDQLTSELGSLDPSRAESQASKTSATVPDHPVDQDSPEVSSPPAMPPSPPFNLENLSVPPQSGDKREDLLLALQADVLQPGRQKDLSLLRELKDEHVDANELNGDLEVLLGQLRGTKP